MITPSFTVRRDPYRLELVIPGLPRMTNPSGAKSTHWRVIKNERDSWKTAVQSLVRPLSRPRAPLQTARLTLTRYSSVAPDPDGLVSGFKALVDGLKEAGVIQDDKFTNIGMPNYRWERAPQKQGYVRVIVEEIT